MSADHRKPVVAFVVLAVFAAVLIGFHRADARSGQFFASLLGVTDQVRGTLPQATWSADEAPVPARRSVAGVTYSAPRPGAREAAPGTRSRGTARADRQQVSGISEARDRRPPAGPPGRERNGVTQLPRDKTTTAHRTVERVAEATARSLEKTRREVEKVARPHTRALKNALVDTLSLTTDP